MIAWPAKDPADVLDYSWIIPLDDQDELAPDGLTAEALDPTTATVDDSEEAEGTATLWISGGADGELAMFNLVAVTAGGRTFREVAVLPVFDRASVMLAELRVRYPEFADVADETIGYWMLRSLEIVTTDFGDQRTHAALLLTAHNLTLAGLGTGAESQRHGSFAGATRVKSGTLELSWEGGASNGAYGQTRYGRLLMPILRANYGGPLVTATGAFPAYAPDYPWR